MGWLDDWLGELGGVPAPAKPRAIAAPIDRPAPEIKIVWFQTRAPRNGDAGGTEAGFYSVAGDVLTMRTEDGKPTGKTHRLAAGEDARQIAGRLAKEAWLKSQGGGGDFNRPLRYGP